MNKAFYRPADRASDLSLAIAVIVSLATLQVFPENWFLVALPIGLGARLALLWPERTRLRINRMKRWMFHYIAVGWERETGVPMPRSSEQFRMWVQSPKSGNAPATRRADALKSFGDLPGMRYELAHAMATTPDETADLECSRFELSFEETADGDTTQWREAISKLSGDEAKFNRVQLASYEAEMMFRDGGDWLGHLQAAYEANKPFPIPLSTAALPYVARFAPVFAGVAAVGILDLILGEVLLPF